MSPSTSSENVYLDEVGLRLQSVHERADRNHEHAQRPAARALRREPRLRRRRLGTSPDAGLSEAEAARRLGSDGPNELPSEPPVPA